MAVKVKVAEIQFRAECYPRERPNKAKIEEYAELVSAGIEFPPIVLEKDTHILYDGFHRWKGHEKAEREEINAEFIEDAPLTALIESLSTIPAYSDEDLKRIVDLEEKQQAEEAVRARKNLDAKIRSRRKLVAAEWNSRHGLHMEMAEKRETARDYVLALAEGEAVDVADIARRLSVSDSTLYGWIEDLLKSRVRERNNLIYRLHLLGWTQAQIAEQVTKTLEPIVQRTASESLENIPALESSLKAHTSAGKSPAQIAELLFLEQTVVWALMCREKEDRERFGVLKLKPEDFNLWEFQTPDPRLGQDHPGRIPGQILLNLLYYYTRPGDWVYDPMAGGGVTLDACLLMGRRGFGTDIEPRRKEIVKHDIMTGFPELPRANAKPALIFLDPPYWTQKQGEYSDDATNWANLSLEAFYQAFTDLVRRATEMLPAGGRLAVIVGPTQKAGVIYDHALRFAEILGAASMALEHRIIVPYTTQQVTGAEIETARKGRTMLKLYRDLLVARKP